MADSFGSLFGGTITPGPWDKPYHSPDGPDEFEQVRARLDEYVAALAERDQEILALIDEIARLRARGDRFKANGQRSLAEVKELRKLRNQVEAIRNFAGGWKAMAKATHPDTADPDDRAARTELFKLVQLIFEAR